jgi:signal transduction histidine kinase
LTFKDGLEHQSEQVGVTRDGKESHYVVTTAPLSRGDGEIEHVIEIATDVTEVKKLENEKIEAERLAAVGQTVAGLAHTIKNLLMGLEGGMYRMDSGLKRADATRISEGWDILQRNFEKTTTLVKDFLSFSKGRTPIVKPTDPVTLAQDIVDLYCDTAANQGIVLTLETKGHPSIAPLDPDGIEACITNLVSNGIDAAILNAVTEGKVTIRVYENDEELIFEVEDNGCGMDQKIKQQVFTTFFTTKGGQGTGLGLLTTRKIIQEHGGSLEMNSELGQGSIFRVHLPRTRLETIEKSQHRDEELGETYG